MRKFRCKFKNQQGEVLNEWEHEFDSWSDVLGYMLFGGGESAEGAMLIGTAQIEIIGPELTHEWPELDPGPEVVRDLATFLPENRKSACP